MPTINVSETTYRKLLEQAERRRMSLEQFLDSVAGLTVHPPSKVIPFGTPEWMVAFDSWIASHQSNTCIADDSRDAIY